MRQRPQREPCVFHNDGVRQGGTPCCERMHHHRHTPRASSGATIRGGVYTIAAVSTITTAAVATIAAAAATITVAAATTIAIATVTTTTATTNARL